MQGFNFNLRRDRDSNPGYPFEVRLFSKQVLSATQASLLAQKCVQQIYEFTAKNNSLLPIFFAEVEQFF
jgi:hypothetical protein